MVRYCKVCKIDRSKDVNLSFQMYLTPESTISKNISDFQVNLLEEKYGFLHSGLMTTIDFQKGFHFQKKYILQLPPITSSLFIKQFRVSPIELSNSKNSFQ